MAKVDLTKQPYNLDAEDIKWVEDSIASMSIDEKIGQLFFNMGASTEPEYLKDVLDTYHISGVRYNKSKANVSVTENSNLDQGHVIADSLGGVSNAYNITPQDSVLNRHGDQAYMERNIVQAGGATNFEAIITYPDTTTQVPSSYKYTYTINGYQVVDEFQNINPDEYNAAQGLTREDSSPSGSSGIATFATPTETAGGDVSAVDTNGNGQVTIQEAKNAGYAMPIYSDHWLYPYMDDRDGDRQVGE